MNNRNQLSCKFDQRQVFISAKEGEWNRKLIEAQTAFKSGDTISQEQCSATLSAQKQLMDILEGRESAPDPSGYAKVTVARKTDVIDSMKYIENFCNNRTEENFVNLARHAHELAMRTCSIFPPSRYETEFRFIKDSVGPKGAWVAESAPSGDCGIVDLSRFESETQQIGEITTSFWKFLSRKAITKPNNTHQMGMPCSGLDQAEYQYDWRVQEYALSCDYFEFLP